MWSISFAVICSSLEDVWFEHPFSHFTACFHGNIHPLKESSFEKQGPKYFFHFKYFYNLNEVFLLFLRKFSSKKSRRVVLNLNCKAAHWEKDKNLWTLKIKKKTILVSLLTQVTPTSQTQRRKYRITRRLSLLFGLNCNVKVHHSNTLTIISCACVNMQFLSSTSQKRFVVKTRKDVRKYEWYIRGLWSKDTLAASITQLDSRCLMFGSEVKLWGEMPGEFLQC